MSDGDRGVWTTEAEVSFVRGLGTHTDYGARMVTMGEKAAHDRYTANLLRSYIASADRRSKQARRTYLIEPPLRAAIARLDLIERRRAQPQ